MVPASAPLWLALVVAMPRVNRPRSGPPTTPNMVKEAYRAGNRLFYQKRGETFSF